MGKFLIVAFTALGFLVVLNALLPAVWRYGFNVESYHIPWGFCIMGGFCVMVWKAVK